MRRIPAFVARRNRNSAEADANAAYYSPAARGQYKLDLGMGNDAISIDVLAFCRENNNLMPADRRKMREMRAGDTLEVPAFREGETFVLHCLVPESRL